MINNNRCSCIITPKTAQVPYSSPHVIDVLFSDSIGDQYISFINKILRRLVLVFAGNGVSVSFNKHSISYGYYMSDDCLKCLNCSSEIKFSFEYNEEIAQVFDNQSNIVLNGLYLTNNTTISTTKTMRVVYSLKLY